MQGDERARLGDSSGIPLRAKNFMAKTAAIAIGGIMLAGALVISLAFFVVALAVVLVAGGYIWWKTRHLRRQIREQMRAPNPDHDPNALSGDASSGDVIEGVVISREDRRV